MYLKYERLSRQQLQELISKAKVLKYSYKGKEKVFVVDDLIYKEVKICGFWHYLNLWRKSYSSNKYCRAANFKKIGDALAALGVATPGVEKIYLVPHRFCHFIVYPKLEGEILKNSDLSLMPEFVADLHQKGIYFDDLHPLNILKKKDGNMALLDIEKIKIFKESLSRDYIFTNLAKLLHVFTIDEIRQFIKAYALIREQKQEFVTQAIAHVSAVKQLDLLGYRPQESSKALLQLESKNLTGNTLITAAVSILRKSARMRRRAKKKCKL